MSSNGNGARPIQTQYLGYRFRSRLEARWAVFFTALGLEWEYEKEGYEFEWEGLKYLPDFWLPQVRMWAEVKGQDFTMQEIIKTNLLAKFTGFPCLWLVGPPEPRTYRCVEWMADVQEYHDYDVALSMFRDYPLTEHRFYSHLSTDEDQEFTQYGTFGDTVRAVKAALSARFEFADAEPRIP